jgi:HlyD family secretion protein
MKTLRKIWLPLFMVIGVAAAGGIVFYMQPKAQPPVQARSAAPEYRTTPAEVGSVSATIGMTGAVRSKQTTILAWQTSGVIASVPVAKDQTVAKDALLANLDPTSLPQAVILAQANLVSAQKALDNLLLTNQARSNAELAMARAQKALDDAKKARDNKQYQRASQETIDIARANLILAGKALEDAETIYNRNKNRDNNDVVFAAALSQLAAAQQRYDQAKYNLDYVSALPDPLDVQTAQALVDVAQSNLMAAKVEWERDKDGPSDADISAARAQVDAAQAVIDQARLTAPFAGSLTLVKSKVGDQVAPGTLAFQLDDLSRLYVDGEVTEVDIARIQVGQPAELTFDALRGQNFSGKVSEIASVGKSISGTVSFTVTIEINQPDARLRPGMTAAADITASSQQGALLVPNQALRSRQGQPVVYVLKNGAPQAVAIQLGAASTTQTQVTAVDLKPGDPIVLNPAGLP